MRLTGVQRLKAFAKAVVITVLAAAGAGSIVDGLKAAPVQYAGNYVFVGVVWAMGAFFLYRLWFWHERD
jgi:hypothetical protein